MYSWKDRTVAVRRPGVEQLHALLRTTFQTTRPEKLISTSYAPDSKKYKTEWQPSLFEQDAPQFDPAKTSVRGKIFVLDHDRSGDGVIDFHDIEWQYLEGDGDFRSREVTALRDEADIIVTNPPFSLFREFLAMDS